jgi:N-acetylglucosamine kinase-like BadF-type ATPase
MGVLAYPFRMTWVLGFDGGGTKTECALLDESGKTLTKSISGPSNPFRIGIEAATHAIETAADIALATAGKARPDVAALGAGLAGTGDAERHDAMEAALRKSFPNAKVLVVTDLEATLHAAGDGPGIVLIAGTGSGAIGRGLNGQILREGGQGPFAGDEGSAYDIGKQVVEEAAAAWEQTETQCPLGIEILRHLNCATWDEVRERARQSGDEVYPRIFPLVAGAANSGDPLARKILALAAKSLAALAFSLHVRLDLKETPFFLAKAGGTIGRSTFFDRQLDSELRQLLPHAKLGPLRMSPAEAAGRMAMSRNG